MGKLIPLHQKKNYSTAILIGVLSASISLGTIACYKTFTNTKVTSLIGQAIPRKAIDFYRTQYQQNSSPILSYQKR